MKVFENLLNKNTLLITFCKGEFTREERAITIRGKSDDEIFQEKLQIVEETSSRNHSFWFSKKSIIKAYKEIEPRFEEIYNKEYSSEPINYNYNLTVDEKEFMDKCLDFYRNQNCQ